MDSHIETKDGAVTVPEVAARYRVSRTTVLKWIDGGHLGATPLPSRGDGSRRHFRIDEFAIERFEWLIGGKKGPPPRREIDPTPEEIAAACAEIQKTWSPEERRKRETGLGYRERPRVEITEIRLSEIGLSE